MTANELNDRIEEYKRAGWKYHYDGQNWSSGSWYHEEFGSVNNRGGSFRSIVDAVEALDRFVDNWSKVQ